MQYSRIILVLMVIAAAVAGCQAAADHPVSRALPPSAGTITPDPVHSSVTSGSDSDAASGSTVIEQQNASFAM
jgi:hypothetical protein